MEKRYGTFETMHDVDMSAGLSSRLPEIIIFLCVVHDGSSMKRRRQQGEDCCSDMIDYLAKYYIHIE